MKQTACHTFTTLIIRNAHSAQLHSGVNATLTALRQKYWIPCARQRIKSIIRKCVVCRKAAGKGYTIPDPPPLVTSRVNHTDPFTVTGVDFTGALYVRASEVECKVYLIPKRAPWFGGFWERLIRLTKSALKKILGRTRATLESLQTIVVEVEALLND